MMRSPEPVPVPDFSSFQIDERLTTNEMLVIGLLVVLGVFAVLSIPWIRRHPDQAGPGQLAVVNLLVFAAIFGANWKHHERRDAELEEQAWHLFGLEVAVAEELSDRLEAYYGIEFAEMPSFPERDDPPSYALVKEGDRVKLCWVHVVIAPPEGERLAISCGTHDAATSTELPAVEAPAEGVEEHTEEDAG